jgi:EAL domain-containing protein (putative c-di-GMP-specific phosphodiesterase class I)
MRLLSSQTADMSGEPSEDLAMPQTTVASLAVELNAALGIEPLLSLSVHDRMGDPVWMSGDLVGPDEHAIALEAITVFEVEGHRSLITERLGDDLTAVLLPIVSARGDLHGIAVLIARTAVVEAAGGAKIVTGKVRSILQRLGIVMKPVPVSQARRSAGTTSLVRKLRANPFASIAPADPDAMPEVAAPAPAVVSSLTRPAAAATSSATGRHAALKPEQIREISLHVQQLMKLRSGGRTRRYEVLVRGKNSAAGDAMDETLVRALSLTESAGAIDRLVVASLAKWLKANPAVWNTDPSSFSVNLSLGSLLDPAFARFVTQCLQSSGVAPDTIGFEIPEAAFLKHRDAVVRFIAECEKVGCYIVIDDFTLHHDVVPFLSSRAMRVIKINPTLTTAAMTDRLSQAVVIAISQASKVLGLHCVAKRIDSTAARQWLAAVGIDFAQGYVLEDPRPIETLAQPASRSAAPA